MLSRINAAIKSGDAPKRAVHFVYGKLLFSLPPSWRLQMYKGQDKFCPICGSNLKGFLSLYRPYHQWCPVCKSLARHRFVWLFFSSPYSPILTTPQKMLHIAPEPALQEKFQALPNMSYVSGDLYNKKAMVKMDICNIQCPDQNFDLIYCSHVLEHVPSDRQALAEFRRVLKDDGALVIMVPILGEQNFEDPAITDPAERERVYGQHDHVRLYGNNFPEVLEQAGFTVQSFVPSDFADPDEIIHMGLDDNDIVFLCRKSASDCA